MSMISPLVIYVNLRTNVLETYKSPTQMSWTLLMQAGTVIETKQVTECPTSYNYPSECIPQRLWRLSDHHGEESDHLLHRI